jgi:hypothetical protein
MSDFEYKQTAVCQYDEQELKDMCDTVLKTINAVRDLKTILNPKLSESVEPVLRDATTLMNKLNDDMRTLRQMRQ